MLTPSDEALELLDFMVEANATSVSRAATSEQLMTALDIRGLDKLDELLRELVAGGYVRKRFPPAITGRSTYHVDQAQFDRLVKALDPDADQPPPAKAEPDWVSIKGDIERLAKMVDETSLSQSQRAQAGAITSALRILVEAPEPPKKAIRELLYLLAAVATIFALALEVLAKL